MAAQLFGDVCLTRERPKWIASVRVEVYSVQLQRTWSWVAVGVALPR